MAEKSIPEDERTVELRVIRVKQPIGDFYIASVPSTTLCEITYFDVRRMLKERDVETYLGIQRPLSKKRVTELQKYVRTFDACFPTGIILAVEGRCAEFSEQNGGTLTLRNIPAPDDESEPVYYRNIAKVLDGQHRIAGLEGLKQAKFEVNVSIFVDIDIEDQAYIFSTVNLAQTKVNPSLALDLFELAKSRSPQKTCHNIAVALDRHEKSPFFQKIKRLGVRTAGRLNETLSQAMFVNGILPFITEDPVGDRDTLLRHGRLIRADAKELESTPLRNLFIDEKDLLIADIFWNYFDAVRSRWPTAWAAGGEGIMLNRTNGFRALIRVFRPAYRHLVSPGDVPTKEAFLSLFRRARLKDEDFNTETFKPGTSGESLLVATLVDQMGLNVSKRQLIA